MESQNVENLVFLCIWISVEVAQGCPILPLEGHCTAEFSSNPAINHLPVAFW